MLISDLAQNIQRNVNDQNCWTFSEQISYPKLHDGENWVSVHKLMHELMHGPVPDGMYVCHHCDHPWCINPDHLFLGTPLDNYWDARVKNRVKVPERTRQHVFVDPDNMVLLALWAKQEGRELSDQMNWIIRERQALASIESMAS